MCNDRSGRSVDGIESNNRKGTRMSNKITRTTAVAAVLAAVAIAAPSAVAQPVDPPLPAGINAGLGPSSGLAAIARPADDLPVAAPADSSGGFDWGDASIGAAGMLSLLGLGAGSVVLIRRSGHTALRS